MPTLIRLAQPPDAAAIAALHKAARLAAYRDLIDPQPLEQLANADLTELWTRRLGSPEPPTVFFATRSQTPVGYCMVVPIADQTATGQRVAELTRMSVSPQAWRTGVGSALTHHALDFLRREGWTAVVLWVLVRNEAAQAFYSRLGFDADGATQLDPWSGQTQVRLRLSLAPSG